MVRLYKPSKLMEASVGTASGPHHKGFLAAYNPATGEDSHDDDAYAAVGMLFCWESTGALKRGGGTPMLLGAQPFKWEKIEENTLHFRRTGKGASGDAH